MRVFTPSCRHRSPIIRYGLAVAAVATALGFELLLAHNLGPHLILIGFSAAVALVAWCAGPGPGILAIVLSLAATDRYFVGMGALLTVVVDDVVGLVTFGACWLALTLLVEAGYRRLRREGTWRLAAQRMAEQKDRMEHFTAAIFNARTTAEAVEASVQESVYAMGAEAGGIWLAAEDGRSSQLARAIGYAPELLERWQTLSLETRSPFADAVRTRGPVIFDSRDERFAEYPAADDLYAAAHEASIAVPLIAGGRPVAVLRLDYARRRTFETDDRQFLILMAPRAAQALDRTAQHEATLRARAEAERERARADEELAERQRIEQELRASEARYRALAARTRRLHDLSAALSESVTLGAVAHALVRHAKIVVGATGGSVALLAEHGAVFETLYMEDDVRGIESEGERYPRADGLCATAAVGALEPVFVGSFAEWQERYWRSASLAADGGYTSGATLPLVIDGEPIGVLEFQFMVPVNFDREYRALLVSVAHHCAQALDRARLYETAQSARAEAEAANRLKDEFLSMVSHELRTPLNSILGWADLLRKGKVEQSRAQRALQAIEENAARQARLVDELLDFSRITAGRTTLDLQQMDLAPLLNAVTESVLPEASSKGIDLHVDAPADLAVVGDAHRLEQVFFNLLGNAIKFTAKGGKVHVRAATNKAAVEVSVADTGIGIDQAFLPHVFERFRQANRSVPRTYGGLGLGLSIARQLVEAHKGSIHAESEGVGRGATFTVKLPLAGATAARKPDRQPEGGAIEKRSPHELPASTPPPA